MPAPATPAEFLALVRRSGVAENKLVEAALPRLPATTDPVAVAEVLVREGALTRFQAEQLLLGKLRGFTIGHYKVLERLGSGGMAVVYLCEHLSLRRRVAIKVLPTAKAEDVAVLKRFYREAQAGSTLNHPNIVHIHNVSQDGALHFLVMEYVEGTLLGSLVKKHGPLDVLRACHYVRQAALGLEHIFEAGLVHRDIKPDNLILDRSGTVKVLDLGLARVCSGSDEVLTKGILGTPDYLAPEQTQDSHLVDIRADIYSLGGTFYYLLTGQPPFGEGTTAQKLQWHKTKQPTPVRRLRPDVPETVEQLITRMMAKDPDERFPSPLAVANFLIPWTKATIRPPAEAELPQFSDAENFDLSQRGLDVTPGDSLLHPTPSPAANDAVKRDTEEPPEESRAVSPADLMRAMGW